MIYDCIIIGSGVAGLTAALYLGRAKKSVMIIEDSVIGGTTATIEVIENYPGFTSISGIDLINNMISQVSKLGVNIDIMQIKSIDFDKKQIVLENNTIEYKALIIASGTSSKRLNIPEETKYQFRGLSYCAVCDGNLFKNKDIVVVTNNNSGLHEIEYLSNLTSNLIVVNQKNNLDYDKHKVYNNSHVIKIYGENRVEGIEIISNNNETINIKCDAIFVALGKETNLSLYKDKINIIDGFIQSNDNMHTNIEGVFVAGDIRKKSLRQIVTACSDGAIAGTEVIKYIYSLT